MNIMLSSKNFKKKSTVHDLCAVLGMDFLTTVTEVHPSLNDSTGVQSKSISNETLSRLAETVLALKEDKKQRLQKVATLALILLICDNEAEPKF
ncbi:UNVERIFIED_CONTAM: microtubule-associated protein 1 [Sesamum radiatum]|uniref:Microtubule-associated protein 1 n=1 Tax=Sesamum radiatum TaxID=300843 RepID=A0AAW2T326_SESRA